MKFVATLSSILSLNFIVAHSAFASVAVISGAGPTPILGTTAASEADLAGSVVQDNLLPFRILNAAGALLFEGKLQNRIVRSTQTGLLHFYYRIRDTKAGLNGIVKNVTTQSFALSPRTLADWRPDGLGAIDPFQVERSGGAGSLLRFDFDSTGDVLVGGQESKFFYIKTMNKNYKNLGQTRITLTTGDSTTLTTLAPAP
jgi:hypothetical protein